MHLDTVDVTAALRDGSSRRLGRGVGGSLGSRRCGGDAAGEIGGVVADEAEQPWPSIRGPAGPSARPRTQLAYGEFLRRSRRRVDARTPLRAALDVFTEVGAQPWADRARQELRASGETARKRDPSTSLQLTPQEQQVASLVSRGHSNADVAAQLFLSRRTVEFHLSNAYQKLGVRSRGDLVRLALS